jgi:hypothetical protein
MRIPKLFALYVTLFLIVVSSPVQAQQAPDSTNVDSTAATAPQSQVLPVAPSPNQPKAAHRFWDRENDLLFGAVTMGRFLDYASTLNLRARGIDEVFLTNSIVDNHPLFAGIEVAGIGASIGVSYLFHRTGHHTLERWTSVVHFGVATGGAVRNYLLKTQPPR